VLVGLLVAAQSAHAYIYWLSYDSNNSRVGRADLTGLNPNGSLVTGIYYGAGVAADGTHVYWGQSGNGATVMGSIGRANSDGTSPDAQYQTAATYCGVFGVRATPTDLFWLKSDCSSTRRIDHAPNLGGQSYNEPGAGSGVCGFAIDGSYVYWSQGHYIARSTIAVALPDTTWLDVGASNAPCGVAVDAGHVYWTNGSATAGGGSVGRATIDGNPASVSNSFITGTSFLNNVSDPTGLAVSGAFIYWTNQPVGGGTAGSIGRAGVDGTGVAQNFVPNVFFPVGLDVDAAGPAPAPPGGAGGGGGPTPPPPPPLIVGVGSTHSSFAPGDVSTPLRGKTAKRVPRGTVFSFKLDQPATVSIAIKKRKAGRLAKGRCRKPTRKTAHKRRCDLTVVTLKRTAHSGLNKVPFSGRIRRKALALGRYRAVFTAKGTGGTSKAKSVAFRIVKP
jgi:hypothetical protein